MKNKNEERLLDKLNFIDELLDKLDFIDEIVDYVYDSTSSSDDDIYAREVIEEAANHFRNEIKAKLDRIEMKKIEIDEEIER